MTFILILYVPSFKYGPLQSTITPMVVPFGSGFSDKLFIDFSALSRQCIFQKILYSLGIMLLFIIICSCKHPRRTDRTMMMPCRLLGLALSFLLSLLHRIQSLFLFCRILPLFLLCGLILSTFQFLRVLLGFSSYLDLELYCLHYMIFTCIMETLGTVEDESSFFEVTGVESF